MNIPYLNKLENPSWTLLIFSGPSTEFTLSAQYSGLKDTGILDRLQVLHVSELNIPDKFGKVVPARYHETLTIQFGIPEEEYTAILLNPDLREKLRSNDVITYSTLDNVLPDPGPPSS